MDFRINDEQRQMRETAREFFEDREVLERARERIDGEAVVDDLWADLSEMDYPALTIPLEYNGLGDDVLYLSLLLEEAGRVALPAPLPETLAFGAFVLDELGTDDQKEEFLPAIADGEQRLSFALYESGQESLPRDIQLAAAPTDEGYRLDGTKTLVPFGKQVDTIVVAARTGSGTGMDGISLFLVDAERVDSEPQDTLDRTRPTTKLHFDDFTVDESALLGTEGEAGSVLQEAMDRYTVATCAMTVGAASRAVEMSSEYGSQREQFDKPIGQFQAVKHRIADMWMATQAARSLTYYAAWALENDEEDAARAVSEAKLFCSEQLTQVFADDIHNHGGMGFTSEHDGHIYFKQAKAWETFLGTPTEHLDRIADSHDL
ncbi:acyl-CoA dehydrogenase family protein [Halococcus qingdaonensis]|uniref:acyl-CoA dehydrogenase family protein n=1 Tax=Halococcus qingdaonensis TaxID=224402 RepID=UPI00211699A5|nr:acyl-CoA dehydrogenase [Halococcus qingdaonensis]